MAKQKTTSGVHASWPKPDFKFAVTTNKNFKRNYYGAILYAHYELSSIELKREVVKYLKSIDSKHPWILRIKDIDDHIFTTVGKYMYLLNNGADLPEEVYAGMMPALEKAIVAEEFRLVEADKQSKIIAARFEAAPVVKTAVSIQDRIRDRAREVSGEIEGWIDDFMMDKKSTVKTIEDFSNLFKLSDLKSPHIKHISTFFEHRASEISEALDGKQKELVEAYSNFTKSELKKFELFHKNLIAACNMVAETAKVERAPKIKKPQSLDKVVSKLKYLKEDTSLGLVSLNPTNIIGATSVWVYNTRTRKLSHYVSDTGLGVKGASLVNFKPESAEKTLRKPGPSILEFKKASKVKLRTFLSDLTTVDTPCNGKINENHIILRIDK